MLVKPRWPTSNAQLLKQRVYVPSITAGSVSMIQMPPQELQRNGAMARAFAPIDLDWSTKLSHARTLSKGGARMRLAWTVNPQSSQNDLNRSADSSV